MKACALAACLAALGAHAADEAAPRLKMSNTLELRAAGEHLTGGEPPWREATLLASRAFGSHLVQAELSAKNRFGEGGAYASVLDTYRIDADWYASAGIGAGDGAFYLPRVRVDALLYRKLGAERQWVLFTGPGYVRSPDGHTDHAWSLGALYYFASPWAVQGTVRFNESDPGDVRTRQYELATTHGAGSADEVTARVAWGREGYQAIGAGTTIVDFPSREAALLWRHRLDARNGVSVSLDHYRNPYYERTGGAIGWFTAWP